MLILEGLKYSKLISYEIKSYGILKFTALMVYTISLIANY
jgi:hypothetical protein